MTLNTDRQQQIARFVSERQRATVEELSAQFSVSEATIRRDLEKLQHSGAVRRAHGGAIAVERAAPEPPVVLRLREASEQKVRIGAAAAELIHDGETVFLGSGTTTQEVARHLGDKRGLTVITNALNIANVIAGYPDMALIITGGLLRGSELSMIGHLAEQALRDLRPEKVIMGIRALDTAEGLTNEYGSETMIDRLVIRSAPQVIVVADSSKFGKVSTLVVAPITSVHTLVTDGAAPAEQVAALRRQGVRVIQA